MAVIGVTLSAAQHVHAARGVARPRHLTLGEPPALPACHGLVGDELSFHMASCRLLLQVPARAPMLVGCSPLTRRPPKQSAVRCMRAVSYPPLRSCAGTFRS
jgi:hypothetical protein